MNGKAIITGDASHPEVAPLSAGPVAKERAYDATLYRSYASFPIGPLLDESALPYGVLVATSDRQGRFDRENAAVLVHVAEAIASLISCADIKIDRLRIEKSDTGSHPPGVQDAAEG